MGTQYFQIKIYSPVESEPTCSPASVYGVATWPSEKPTVSMPFWGTRNNITFIKQTVVETINDFPANPELGWTCYVNFDETYYWYNGTSWVEGLPYEYSYIWLENIGWVTPDYLNANGLEDAALYASGGGRYNEKMIAVTNKGEIYYL